jgi:hypothetical protein
MVEGGNNVQVSLFINSNDILVNLPLNDKGLGAIRAKIGSTSDVDKIFSKMYSQYVLFFMIQLWNMFLFLKSIHIAY